MKYPIEIQSFEQIINDGYSLQRQVLWMENEVIKKENND